MRLGKTKQCIDAAQVLWELNVIDRVLVFCPASVRPVWFDPDPELGEIAKHTWENLPVKVLEFHRRAREWLNDTKGKRRLEWIITNYDFIRNQERREFLLKKCGPRTMLILDESSAVKNYRAKQSKASLEIRRACERVWLLNGTPISNSPGDMFAQSAIMAPTAGSFGSKMLECRNYFHFRAKYAQMGGWMRKQIVAWVNLEDMQKRLAPYILNRRMADCFDLPEQLPPTYLTATMTPETWAIYREMRDEMVAWLDDQTVAVAAQAGVKAMRLAQITSGFLGGLQAHPKLPVEAAPGNTSSGQAGETSSQTALEHLGQPGEDGGIPAPVYLPPREIGREKLDVFLEWLDARIAEDPDLKLLVWCRFRAEIARLHRTLTQERGMSFQRVGLIWGGQKPDERDLALRLLKPATSPAGVAIVIGTPASGAKGLDLSAAHHLVYSSNDYRLETRLQSEARIKHPNRKLPISYVDIVAEGPKGQKTIDHVVLKALRKKQDLAEWTVSAWRAALTDEEDE